MRWLYCEPKSRMMIVSCPPCLYALAMGVPGVPILYRYSKEEEGEIQKADWRGRTVANAGMERKRGVGERSGEGRGGRMKADWASGSNYQINYLQISHARAHI